MLNIKQRNLSIIWAQVLGITTFLLASDGNLKADPAYQHLLDHPADTAYVVDDGYLDFRDHVWLELDPLAARVSVPPEPSNDILDILRHGFSLEPVMNSRVEAELRWFARNPAYMTRVFNRAQRYLPFIVEELEARELPLELALLPIVESAFDPFAYSHGRAAGLWQMIPGTARRFGVRQNWWYDGRRDVVDSTHAALDYLAYLYDLQDGDWPNAIASYNSGEGNVLKARKRNRANGKPEDFWNLRLSRETSAYVPRLFALVAIVRDPAEYGLELPEIVNEPQFAVTEVGSQIDLALAAELAGIDLDTLSSYNAGVNRWATDPGGPHRLVLPIDVAEDFSEAVALVPENERIRWKRHKVRNGEAISQIADKYDVTVSTIRSANNLRGNMIRAGSYLMIPVATKPLTDYSQSADVTPRTQAERRTVGQPHRTCRRFRRELLDDQPQVQREHEQAGLVERHVAARHAVRRPETHRLDEPAGAGEHLEQQRPDAKAQVHGTEWRLALPDREPVPRHRGPAGALEQYRQEQDTETRTKTDHVRRRDGAVVLTGHSRRDAAPTLLFGPRSNLIRPVGGPSRPDSLSRRDAAPTLLFGPWRNLIHRVGGPSRTDSMSRRDAAPTLLFGPWSNLIHPAEGVPAPMSRRRRSHIAVSMSRRGRRFPVRPRRWVAGFRSERTDLQYWRPSSALKPLPRSCRGRAVPAR